MNLSELALSLTGLTGQVFQTHASPYRDEPNQLHARGYACFYVAEITYPKPTRWRVTAQGLDCDSPASIERKSININPNRPSDALARDILHRLPDAPAIYRRAMAHDAKRKQDAIDHAEFVALLEAKGFKALDNRYIYHPGKNQIRRASYYGTSIQELELTGLTLPQISKILEIIT